MHLTWVLKRRGTVDLYGLIAIWKSLFCCMHICISGKLIFHTVQTHFLWLILMYLLYRKDFLGLPVHLISYLKPNPQKHHYILKENNFDKLFANYLQKMKEDPNCQAIMKFPIINCGYLQPWQMNISLVLIRLWKALHITDR